jgi:hypothetical protein
MKRTILLIMIAVISKSLSGQISAGLSIGDNLCKVKKTVDYESNPYLIKPDKEEYLITNGFTIGIPFEINLSDRLSLFTMFSYLQKGTKVKTTTTTLNDFVANIEGTGKYNYLELPLQGKFYFLKNKMNAYISIGPSFGYLLDGKFKYKISVHDIEQDTTSYNNFDEKVKSKDIKASGINRLDISIALGIGIDYKIGIGKIFININYLYGITDMVNDDKELSKGINQYNRGLTTTLGYLIPLTK